ncbi:hypothetical protein PDE_00487 [Penicillium oxalicum 114-2]|uniref:VWFA domain-containing protein n=1 Tax=Penicillium oxalicum (strain 114-2 / CGMCC 5302) TaxID=933388 RepID=S8AIH3_PENO1|nr:hypothetical protein PDE_00487 [Penicillium oxalicum 114-2]
MSPSEYSVPPSKWSSFPTRQPNTQRRAGPLPDSSWSKSPVASTAAAATTSPSSQYNIPRTSIFNRYRIQPRTSRFESEPPAGDPPTYEASQRSQQDHRAKPLPAIPQNSAQIDQDDRFAFLKDFDTIFLVDDSSSMSGRRWTEAEEAISAIAPICTKYDADGIDIYFLNHHPVPPASTTGGYCNVTTAESVRKIFRSVRPERATPVGRRLLHILQPYLRRVQAMQTARAANGGVLEPSLYVKPVNIITITDGQFTDDAESVIVQVARTLDRAGCDVLPWQVGIQFFQIGENECARRFLQELDDDLGRLCREEKVRDIVDTVPWRGISGHVLDAEGILKCVLGAVNKKYDRRDRSA